MAYLFTKQISSKFIAQLSCSGNQVKFARVCFILLIRQRKSKLMTCFIQKEKLSRCFILKKTKELNHNRLEKSNFKFCVRKTRIQKKNQGYCWHLRNSVENVGKKWVGVWVTARVYGGRGEGCLLGAWNGVNMTHMEMEIKTISFAICEYGTYNNFSWALLYLTTVPVRFVLNSSVA